MIPTPSPRKPNRLERLLPLVILALAGVLVAGSLSSCGQEGPQVPHRPGRLEGVPIIRVRLAGPVEGATLSTTGPYVLRVDARSVGQSRGRLAPVRVVREGDAWRFNNLHCSGIAASLEPADDRSFVQFEGMSYRGSLRLVPAAGGGMLVINHLDMESYLAGVLARELYPHWDLETYRALAVAARTFALYHMKTVSPASPYDVGAGQAHQVYGGLAAETERAWAAVGSTHGRVLVHGPPEAEKIFMAQYSACNGGYVNGAWVIRPAQDIPPLAGGQKDDDGRSCPRFLWGPVSIPKSDVHRALAAAYESAATLRGVHDIRVVEQTSYGRPVWLDVRDDLGHSVRIRAEDLRLAILRSDVPGGGRLYSMNCKIRVLPDAIEFYDGRGFGHGVGLSQWGAQDKASRGWNARQILEFYYPGASIVPAY